MTRLFARAVTLIGLVSLGCSRADVFAITEDGPALGGSAGNGGSAGLGNDGGGAGTANAGAPAGGAAGSTAGTAGSGGATAGSAGTAGSEGGMAGSAACPLPPLEPGDTKHTVLVRGVSRSYLLHVPLAYEGSNAVPLVVDFHAAGESGESERASSPYPELLDREGVIMAFPDGLRGPAGAAWNVGPCCVKDADDVAFARALVAQIRQTACIDPKRIYAVGVLTGGGMAHYAACHAADLFAAVAPAAFDLLEENMDDCVPSRPISVISFRGAADPRVPYAGGPSSLVPGMPLTFLGAEATFEKWAAIDRCSGPPSPADSDGCSAYTNCDGGAEVVLCSKRDDAGEHADATIAWPLLSRHTLED